MDRHSTRIVNGNSLVMSNGQRFPSAPTELPLLGILQALPGQSLAALGQNSLQFDVDYSARFVAEQFGDQEVFFPLHRRGRCPFGQQ